MTQRALLAVCGLFALTGFILLGVIADVSLGDGLLCGKAFSLFGVLYFHLDPDWGRLPELLVLIQEVTSPSIGGIVEQVPIVLTDFQLKTGGTGHVGAGWVSYMARLNYET